MQILPVILSGGSGTRMWPLSRHGFPKQFLSLWGEDTLLQQTAKRLEGVPEALPPLMISNVEQRFLVAEQLQQKGIKPSAIVLEPVGRNTAPAVAIGALWARERALEQQVGDILLLVLPSDHVITRLDRFRALVQEAAALAITGKLVTFGIHPESPHTGYGYIRRGEPSPVGPGFTVDCFVEKPDAARATAYLASGDYYWNSGMFMFRASAYLSELRRYLPGLLASCETSLALAKVDDDFLRLDGPSFQQCPSDSIDYAIMERTREAAVLGASELGWSDIGDWSALSELAPQDNFGNNLVGNVLVEDAQRCYLRSEGRLIAALGIQDLVVVETPDAILVAQKARTQDVKKLVERLKTHKMPLGSLQS